VTDQERVWLRFEGPGKLHHRRWHIAQRFPHNSWATLCGLVVRDAQVEPLPGDGPRCVTCESVAARQPGGYL